MYYYVFEQPHSNVERKVNEKVRSYISDLGITGEISVASPARSAEELTDMGLKKGVGTVIAVGSDRHVNRVVSLIKTAERGLRRDVVLGVVPTSPNSVLRERLRLDNLRSACEALKYRRFTTVDLSYVDGVLYFLTSVEIRLSRPAQFHIKADRWEVEQDITDLVIFSDLSFSFFNSFGAAKGQVDRWLSWLFGGKSKDNDVSIFKSKTLQVHTESPLPVLNDGEMITKTPIVVYKLPRALKLIIKRDKFISESKIKESG